MYPFIRMAKELAVNRNATPLPLTGTHVSHHVCWPWDLDMWIELNNGRTLTLYDLGRIPLARRVGLVDVLRRRGWGLTMAGASVRWRQRVRTFERIEMHSRCVGWDDRFIYLEQSMWKANGTCASQAIYRAAVTGRTGIVPTDDVMAALGVNAESPPYPPTRCGLDRSRRRARVAAATAGGVTRQNAVARNRLSLSYPCGMRQGAAMAVISPRKRIWGWMMFDWASQPYNTLLLTFIFGPYFAEIVIDRLVGAGATPEAARAQAQAYWGYGLTSAGVLIAVLAPVLGAIADSTGRRMPWIWVFSVALCRRRRRAVVRGPRTISASSRSCSSSASA